VYVSVDKPHYKPLTTPPPHALVPDNADIKQDVAGFPTAPPLHTILCPVNKPRRYALDGMRAFEPCL